MGTCYVEVLFVVIMSVDVTRMHAQKKHKLTALSSIDLNQDIFMHAHLQSVI